MPISAALARKLSEIDPPLREAMLLLVEEVEKQREQMAQQVTKAEFQELQGVLQELMVSVNRLAEAQVRTEERLERLEATVERLAEAQVRTEARVEQLEAAMARLAEAQARTEERLNQLAEAQARTEARLEELAEAQARTEARVERLEAAVERLAEAQARTEERLERLEATVERLAEAQARTEEELRKLAAEHRVTRERLEGISNSVGYTLEDRAMKTLPAILARQGIQVEGRLVRRYVQVGKKERQLNIFGHGRRNGERVLILGEAKVRPSRQEVDRFVRLARRVAEQEGVPAMLVFVAYDFPPAIESHIKSQGILPVWSYELE